MDIPNRAQSNQGLFAGYNDFASPGMFYSNGIIYYFLSSNGSSWDLISDDTGNRHGHGTIIISLNTWHHIAYIR